MNDSQAEQTQRGKRWRRAPELPEVVFAAWRKPDSAISPIAVVATVDPDGTPHTAPLAACVRSRPGCCGSFRGASTTHRRTSAATTA